MTHLQLSILHLATVLPAFFLGTWLMLRRKGTPLHRLLGKIYMGLMLLTALITLLIPARVGPQFFGHFGFIHGFSLLVLVMVPSAWVAVRRGQIVRHRRMMVGTYVGGLLIAGSFALMPGRLLNDWLFQ